MPTQPSFQITFRVRVQRLDDPEALQFTDSRIGAYGAGATTASVLSDPIEAGAAAPGERNTGMRLSIERAALDLI